MKKKKLAFSILILNLIIIFIFGGCQNKSGLADSNNNKTEYNQESKFDDLYNNSNFWDSEAGISSEENHYINCEPGYQKGNWFFIQVENEQHVRFYDMEEYLLAKESIGWPSEEWLSWEQFAALGDFYSASWWPSTPASVEYEYLYTDFNTKNTWIYHVDFEKLREDSGVTNIKEYNQWYLGCEWDLTVESDSGLNRRLVVNTPTISSDSFSDSNLTNIDPNDSIFKNCKNQYGDVGYYVDNMIEFTYYKETDSVRKLQFVYNGWLISIHKRKKDDLKSAIDNTDCKILQKLVNANTYKEAIAELMDPTNQNLPKQPVDSETARQIKKGMTYSEIHEILRNPGKNIGSGSGATLYEWELDNGDVLQVLFPLSTELIAINVRIDQKS